MSLHLRVAPLLILVLSVAACADEGDGTATPESPPTSASIESPSPTETPSPVTETAAPTSAAPTTEPSVSPSPSPLDLLEDGEHFGYIRSIDLASGSMVFDLAYFLTGEEANQAAAERGDESPVPNDYYIINDNPRLRALAPAPDVELRVIDWGHCCEPVQGEIQPFVDAFATRHHRWDEMYQGAESQYWLTVDDGVIVKIEEQFLP